MRWVWPTVDPWLVAELALVTLVYLLGAWELGWRRPGRIAGWRTWLFLGGIAAVAVASLSPLDTWADRSLFAHMAQHLLLIMVAPPLLLLGQPVLPMLFGVPRPIRVNLLAPVARSRWFRATVEALRRPLAGVLILGLVTFLWHWPRLYEAAMAHSSWHQAEHACFLLAGLVFWWNLVDPALGPARPDRWWGLAVLLIADVQNTILAAVLTFADRPIYSRYSDLPAGFGGTPVEDQMLAGLIMWIPGSLVYLVPAAYLATRLLRGPAALSPRSTLARSRSERSFGAVSSRPSRPPREALDWLRVPVVGTFLRSGYGRPVLQGILFLLAIAIVLDGFFGPRPAPMNLAGTLPWIHWRGLVVLSLLAVGNLFCLSCPLTLPRNLLRRWHVPRRPWPSWLRGKWLAAGIVFVFFWAYEVFALWSDPRATAAIIVALFGAILLVDGVFAGAPFCKFVCPIGQFHFVHATLSPWTIAPRDLNRCHQCDTSDCIRGNQRTGRRGCELELFLPTKRGNLDCTLCLDCIRACPNDNVGMTFRPPGMEILEVLPRSGIGQLEARRDWGILAALFVGLAFANAWLMTAPAQELVATMTRSTGTPMWLARTLLYGVVAGALPLAMIGAATFLSQVSSGVRQRALRHRMIWALVPMGLGMWTAHYLFHLLTSAGTALPVIERIARDTGLRAAEPNWMLACCQAVTPTVLKVELAALDVGLLASLYLVFRVASQIATGQRQRLAILWPWALLLCLLFALGVTTVFLPMEMRGTLPRP